MRGTAMPSSTRGARTRAAILSAARARLADGGYDGTTLARIAQDAGVSEPTVAFHFGSKAGLLVAVMRAYYDQLLDAVEPVLDEAGGPAERLTAFARFWLNHNAENLALLSVFGRHGRRAETDEVVEAFVESNRRVTRTFDRVIDDLKHLGVVREGVPTRIVRDAFFGTAEHLLLGRALTGRPADLEDAADDLVDLLLHGAGVPAGHDEPAVVRIEAKLDRLAEALAASEPGAARPRAPLGR